MINVTNNFKRKMFDGVSEYLFKVDITLVDQTQLHLTNEQIWSNGISIEDAVSTADSFDIGSAIIGKAKVVINNIYDDFSTYDFFGAKVVIYVGLPETEERQDGTLADEYIKKGTFTVDEAIYNGSIITLTAYDNMQRFDQPYTSSALTYPATLYEIVNDACSICDVRLSTNSISFPHSTYVIQNEPDKTQCTFRQVLSWVGQIAGVFCKMNVDGELQLGWYNQQLLESLKDYDGGTFKFTDGDNLDGGTFSYNESTNYDGGEFTSSDFRDMHHIYSVFSSAISTDDVVITNVRIVEKNVDENDKEVITTHNKTTNNGYTIVIEDNDLIHNNAGAEICQWLGTQLVGFQFRKASLTHQSDPTIEAGDIGYYTDYKQNLYRIIFSITTYNSHGSQISISSAQTPSKNSDARYSKTVLNYLEARKELQREITNREQALIDLNDKIDKSGGGYVTEVPGKNGGGTIFYLHDKPKLSESTMVWRIAPEGWSVTNRWKGDDDGNPSEETVWLGGMTVDSRFVAQAIGVGELSFDQASGGTIKLGGKVNGVNNINGVLRIYDENNAQVGIIDNTGVYFKKGTLEGANITGSNISGGQIVNEDPSSKFKTIIKDGYIEFQYKYNNQYQYLGKLTASKDSQNPNVMNSLDLDITNAFNLTVNGNNILTSKYDSNNTGKAIALSSFLFGSVVFTGYYQHTNSERLGYTDSKNFEVPAYQILHNLTYRRDVGGYGGTYLQEATDWIAIPVSSRSVLQLTRCYNTRAKLFVTYKNWSNTVTDSTNQQYLIIGIKEPNSNNSLSNIEPDEEIIL